MNEPRQEFPYTSLEHAESKPEQPEHDPEQAKVPENTQEEIATFLQYLKRVGK